MLSQIGLKCMSGNSQVGTGTVCRSRKYSWRLESVSGVCANLTVLIGLNRLHLCIHLSMKFVSGSVGLKSDGS